MRFRASETVTLLGPPEVPISGVAVAFGEASAAQLGDVVEQRLQIIDPAHGAPAVGSVLRVRGKLAEVLGVRDHTHPLTGWSPGSVIDAVQVDLLLPNTCTITDPVGSGWAWNGTAEVFAPGALVWSGPCGVLDAARVESVQASGGQQVTTGQWIVVIPWDSPPLSADLILTVNTSRDTAMVGRRMVVSSVGGGDMLRGRRLACIDSQEA